MDTCVLVGTAVGGVTAAFTPWQLAVLLGWSVVATVLLIWTWSEVEDCDPARTQLLSTIEDSSRSTALVVMVAASVMSLAGVAAGLDKARQVSQPMEAILTIAAVLTVVLSWFVVHIMFTLRYAHQYYIEPVGGIEFPGDEAPDYRDFAYFSFTVGVAFAVSDAPVSSRRIRRLVLRHALLSYLFGAVIIGFAINVMAGFIR